MIYTRKQIDYWRIPTYELKYCYSTWIGASTNNVYVPGSTVTLYIDSIYLHNDQLFLQVL